MNLVIPTDARAELTDLHIRKSPAQYLDMVWAQRDAEYSMIHGFPATRGQWPFTRADLSNGTQFMKVKRG